jgi:hypothetical protein
MTFEQADKGNRHCDDQNLSDNESFGRSNLTITRNKGAYFSRMKLQSNIFLPCKQLWQPM